MKLTPQKNRREGSRLDGFLFFLVVLWLATGMLFVLLHHSGSTRARHPQTYHQDVIASIVPPAAATYQAARASLMY